MITQPAPSWNRIYICGAHPGAQQTSKQHIYIYICGAYPGAQSVQIAYIYIYMRRTSWRTTWGRWIFLNWRLFRSFENHEKQDLRKKVRRIGGAYPQIETERAGCPGCVPQKSLDCFGCLHFLIAWKSYCMAFLCFFPLYGLCWSLVRSFNMSFMEFQFWEAGRPIGHNLLAHIAGAQPLRNRIYICGAYSGAQPLDIRSIYIIIKIRGHMYICMYVSKQ